MSEQYKALARRAIEEVWNQGKLTTIDELVASNATYHDPNVPGGKFTGPEGVKQFVQIYRTAFPDVHIKVEDQIADGDKVVTRWTATETHKGDLMGIKPTNKSATAAGVDIERHENWKTFDAWASAATIRTWQRLCLPP